MGAAALLPLAIGAAVVGGIGSAISKKEQGDAQSAQYRAQADEYQQQANDVDLQSKEMSEQRRQNLRAGMATIEARRAAAGVGLDSPSAIAIENEVKRSSQRDELVQQTGFNNQRAALLAQVSMANSAASSASSIGNLGAFTSLVGTVGSLAGSGLLGGGGGGAPLDPRLY